MKLILGSKSKGRKEILADAGYIFEIMAADIDEKAIRSDNFGELPLLIARAKAKELLKKIDQSAILITSDQVVVCNGELREKPESEAQARRYLTSYSTYPPQTITAVVITDTQTGNKLEAIDFAKVYFKHIPSEVIEALIKEGKIFHTAGGFMIENALLDPYIERIEGDKTSIKGLPLGVTRELLDKISQ